MPEKVMPGPVEDSCGIREAVCIHTRKIFDSCRDKDCIEDLRFYPKLQCVDIINRALSVKGGSAKLLYVYVDVEPVSFNRGFYTVDMRFFYHVTLQAYLSCPVPVTVLWGAQDRILPPPQRPVSGVDQWEVAEGVGHMLHMERPQLVREAVAARL